MGDLCEELGNGMVMRCVHDDDDARAFVALNEAVTGEGAICERLLRHRPGSRGEDFLLVEDTRAAGWRRRPAASPGRWSSAACS